MKSTSNAPKIYTVWYTDKLTNNKMFIHLVGTDSDIVDKCKVAIERGKFEPLEDNPILLGFRWVDGYEIRPIKDGIERAVRGVKRKRTRNMSKEYRTGYLKGIRALAEAILN